MKKTSNSASSLDPTAPPVPEPNIKVQAHERGKAQKNRPDDCATNSGLRFSDEAPVKTIPVAPKKLKGPQADAYDVIGT